MKFTTVCCANFLIFGYSAGHWVGHGASRGASLVAGSGSRFLKKICLAHCFSWKSQGVLSQVYDLLHVNLKMMLA